MIWCRNLAVIRQSFGRFGSICIQWFCLCARSGRLKTQEHWYTLIQTSDRTESEPSRTSWSQDRCKKHLKGCRSGSGRRRKFLPTLAGRRTKKILSLCGTTVAPRDTTCSRVAVPGPGPSQNLSCRGGGSCSSCCKQQTAAAVTVTVCSHGAGDQLQLLATARRESSTGSRTRPDFRFSARRTHTGSQAPHFPSHCPRQPSATP